MNNIMSKRATGFTLIEILIYISIFAAVAGLMTGILAMVLKVNQKESAVAETTSQLNFTMQTISRLVKESSVIIANSISNDVNNDGQTGSPQTRLVLRMKDSGGSATDRDPIVIWKDGTSIIKMSEGSRISDLTDNKVIVDKLEFTKFSQYPGHDTVSVDIQFTYNSANPNSRITRALQSAIARVSAATFDSNLLPGAANNYDIGSVGASGLSWKQIYMSDGLPASPSYTFSNDFGLGIFKVNGVSALGFSTNSTEKMRIDATGNVGIGTTSPSRKLHITDSSNWPLRLTNSGDGPITMELERTGSSNIWGVYRYGSSGSDRFGIGIIGVNEPFVITTSGNVGIGTTSPNTQGSPAKLDVRGNIFATQPDDSFSGLFLSRSGGPTAGWNSPGGTWSMYRYGSNAGNAGDRFCIGLVAILEPFCIMPNGNVIIGTTGAESSASKLHIKGNSGVLVESNNNDSYLQMANNGTVPTIGVGYIATAGWKPLGFNVAGGERMRIDTSGNVGIGMASPSEKLEVNGNVKAAAFLSSSDIALKKNIAPISNQLEKVLKLQGVSFDWKADDKNDVGFIAQEVEKVFPEVVYTNKETGLKSVDYAKLIVFLVEAIKEQQKEIEKLKSK